MNHTPQSPPPTPRVRKGACLALFAYDVAPYIDLVEGEKRVVAATHRQLIEKKRRALEYFEYRPAPLAITLQAEPIAVGRHTSQELVDVVIYDFGAITVSYTIPFEGSLSELSRLGSEITDSKALEVQARQHVDDLLRVLPDGGRFKIAEVIEDYVIFHVEEFEELLTPDALCEAHATEIAAMLRAETGPLSEQEVADALATRIAFSPADLAVLDWNAAFLYGRDVDDLRTVIEFANVQLLEMRFLDRQLDEALERSYAIVSRRRWRWLSTLRFYRRDVRQIARLQVDGAILFERVSNALKVFGEEYLSRVYELTALRLRLAAWDASTIRKLGTIDSIYTKLTDEASVNRLEVLEWIIVVLIAISILLSFLP